MKKTLSALLALSTVAAMNVTAFAATRDTAQPTPDLELSFGEETFDTLLTPGETYTFPLYISEDGSTPVPVTDEHVKDHKFRAELKSGKSALSSFKVEEIDDVYSLEVKTEAGWPTKQTNVEGAIKLVQKSNGHTLASADASLTVGYARISDESLNAAQDEEYVYVDSSAPVVTKEQFEKLDKYADGGKVVFTNGTWRYEVRVSGQDSVNLLHNSRAIKEISTKYEDQNFKYVSFPAGPVFDFTGTMTIDVSGEMDDFNGNFFVYRYYKGVLTRMDAALDREDESLSFSTKTLGRFVITDKEIPDGTVVTTGFEGDTTLPQEKPSGSSSAQKPAVKPQNKGEVAGSSGSVQNNGSDKNNPSTGAGDGVAIAVAAALVSLAGAGALMVKKIK